LTVLPKHKTWDDVIADNISNRYCLEYVQLERADTVDIQKGIDPVNHARDRHTLQVRIGLDTVYHVMRRIADLKVKELLQNPCIWPRKSVNLLQEDFDSLRMVVDQEFEKRRILDSTDYWRVLSDSLPKRPLTNRTNTDMEDQDSWVQKAFTVAKHQYNPVECCYTVSVILRTVILDVMYFIFAYSVANVIFFDTLQGEERFFMFWAFISVFFYSGGYLVVHSVLKELEKDIRITIDPQNQEAILCKSSEILGSCVVFYGSCIVLFFGQLLQKTELPGRRRRQGIKTKSSNGTS